ncbi:MAG: pyridoxamine 5'-phosphate oxidase family protein [Alphaproteobacteria bacterium]|nr:pyridoxamine 5'-phosphate oxidase family protein [Alphaproteobacteria bacterium]
MKQVIGEQKLGFVASVDADGGPNVSPKGTFLVLDDEHFMFGELRSPNTVRNIAERPKVEVNFVDPIIRKGIRVKGDAHFAPSGSEEFVELEPQFREVWGELCDILGGIVVIKVEKAAPLSSPAYDVGTTEEELKEQFLTYFTQLHSN